MRKRSKPMTTARAACWAAVAGAILVLAITVPALFALLNYRSPGPEDLGALGLIIIALWPLLMLQNAESILKAHGIEVPLNYLGITDSTGSRSTDLSLVIAFNAAFGAVCGLLIYFTFRLLRSGLRQILRDKA